MNKFKKVIKKIIVIFHKPKSSSPFFTRDIFKDKKYLIGEYTYGKPTVLFENNDVNLSIGKFCSIADNVTIFLGGNHRTDWISTYPFNVLNLHFPEGKNINGHPCTKGDVIIGNDVWIGRNAVIMSGVSIGNGAVIAAGSVISKNISDYEIWGGNPARLLKKRFDEESIQYLTDLNWWDWDIEKIRANIIHLCSSDIIKLLKNEK